MFGLYLRYLFCPRFTLYRALKFFLVLDIISLLFTTVYLIPVFIASGRTLNARLISCMIQLVIQIALIYSTFRMLITNTFKIYTLVCYILRLVLTVDIMIEMGVYTIISPEITLSILANIFPAFWFA